MKKYLSRVRLEGRVKEVETIPAIVPASGEELQDLYLETMNEINNSYIEGTIIFIEKNHPELDAKIDEVDARINEIWESCMQGKAGLDDFKAELALYKSLYMQGIELFRDYENRN